MLQSVRTHSTACVAAVALVTLVAGASAASVGGTSKAKTLLPVTTVEPTSRAAGAHEGLKLRVAFPAGSAGAIKRVVAVVPGVAPVAPAVLRCRSGKLVAGRCPAGSAVGSASVKLRVGDRTLTSKMKIYNVNPKLESVARFAVVGSSPLDKKRKFMLFIDGSDQRGAMKLVLAGSPLSIASRSRRVRPRLVSAAINLSGSVVGRTVLTTSATCGGSDAIVTVTSTVGASVTSKVRMLVRDCVTPNGEPSTGVADLLPVPVAPLPDVVVTPPETTITAAPSGTISSGRTKIAFTSPTVGSTFRCSTDGGAFAECSSPHTAGLDSYGAHTFSVFAVGPSGVADQTPATAQFSSKAVDVTVSTTQAAAHPDIDVAFANNASSQFTGYSIKMPNGLMPSAFAVAEFCTVADAQAGLCSVDTRIGNVAIEFETPDGEGTATGSVHMTASMHNDPAGCVPVFPPTDPPCQELDPVGISILADAVINDVSVGEIIATGRVEVRGNAEGVNLSLEDFPTQLAGQSLHVSRVALSVFGDVGAPDYPLITNPSSCAPSEFAVDVYGQPTATTAAHQDFQATGCELVPFGPLLGLSLGNPTAGLAAGTSISADVTLAPEDGTVSSADVLLPVSIKQNNAGLGAEWCSEANVAANTCGPESKLGTAYVDTRLLPLALEGEVHAVDPGSDLFAFVVFLDGMTLVRLRASVVVEGSRVRIRFDSVPDASFTSFNLEITGAPPSGDVTAEPVPLLKVAAECYPVDNANSTFVSHSAAEFSQETSVNFQDCQPSTQITSGPTGSTTETQPTFEFGTVNYSSAAVSFECKIDSGAYSPCTSPYNVPAPLTFASHTFTVRGTAPGGLVEAVPATRSFTVVPAT